MAEETKKENSLEPPVSFGMLLLLAVGGRLLFNSLFVQFPSVEPVIPTAILAGIYYGPGIGIVIGVLGYAFSNLFIASLGEWTIWQSVGGLIAGYMGVHSNRENYLMNVVIATVIFEIIINFYGAGYTIDSGYFFGSIAFSITHIVANVIFAVLFRTWYLKEEQGPQTAAAK